MSYLEVRAILEKLANDNYRDFIKALISFENGINDEEILDNMYFEYMKNDEMSLINDIFK